MFEDIFSIEGLRDYVVDISEITVARENGVFIKELELSIAETFREAVEKLVRKEL